MSERERLFFDSSDPAEDLVIDYFNEWHNWEAAVTQSHYEYIYNDFWHRQYISQSPKPRVACRAAAFGYIQIYVLETSGTDCPACLKRSRNPDRG
ncbi:hypothetical protein ACFCZ1_26700 [Streptomyces sp. NPDC056224]|uniref:hypothetical protein n=1 Tax=Streptomyces sp. NPDC056224 TaxID=3345750 RepID=UPI0035D7E92E